MTKDKCRNGHRPDIWVNKTSQVHRNAKCLDCGKAVVSVANSRWMTNEEYRQYISPHTDIKNIME